MADYSGKCERFDRFALAFWVIVGLVCIAGVLSMQGCAGKGLNPFAWVSPPKPPTGTPSPADPFWFLPWIAGACAAFAVAALIASVFVPLIPRKAAFVAIGCAVGAGLLKAFLAKFLGVMLWGAFGLLLVGGLAAGWPYVMALVNWSQDRLGRRLAESGDPRAGVALMAKARGLTKPNGAHQSWRKNTLAKFEAMLASPKPDSLTPGPASG